MNYKPLSREFLLARGKCCKNSCAFCPYKNKNMEEEEKYYTPNIEDIYIGYEYEEQDYKKRWESRKARDDAWGDFATLIIKQEIRVPYLTITQIENEGWEYTKAFHCLQKNNWSCWIYDKNQVTFSCGEFNTLTFNCLSINEFRCICKLLNIK